MKHSPPSFAVDLRSDGLVVGRDSRFADQAGLQHQRSACGLRHALVTASVSLLPAR
jgi:hypothetical protein